MMYIEGGVYERWVVLTLGESDKMAGCYKQIADCYRSMQEYHGYHRYCLDERRGV